MEDVDPILEVRDLVVRFGPIRAVDGATLAVPRGSMTALIGPNGAGKSTLFHGITGVHRPAAGEVRFGAEPRVSEVCTGEPPDRLFRRGLAHTFQLPRPFPRMSVLDNMLLAPIAQTGETLLGALLQPRVVRREEAANAERAAELLDFVTLGAHADCAAAELSGGQCKLLELARVLMREPALVLLDEPAAGVSPALVDVLADKLAALNAGGTSVLVIEHDMEFVARLCHPVIAMHRGKVVFEGSASEARRDPVLLEAWLGGAPPPAPPPETATA